MRSSVFPSINFQQSFITNASRFILARLLLKAQFVTTHVQLSCFDFMIMVPEVKNVFSSGDLIAIVDEVHFRVSSHVLSMVSEEWNSIIADVRRENLASFKVQLPDHGADAFEYIMNVAHHKSKALPPTFLDSEVGHLADFCEKYNLGEFFESHDELLERCLERMSSGKMKLELKAKAAWAFGNKKMFEEAWHELRAEVAVTRDGLLYRSLVDLNVLFDGDMHQRQNRTIAAVDDTVLPRVVKGMFGVERA